MKQYARICVVAALAVVALGVPGRGDEAAGTRIRPVEADKVEAAKATVSRYTPEQQMLINGLRFLMRPEYEEEMFYGRPYRPCMLEPFAKESDEPLSQLEQLRLWAVLTSGYPETPALKRQVERFLDTDEPETTDSLAPYAVALSICTQIHRREGLADADDLKKLADDILDNSEDRALKELTSKVSRYRADDNVDPRWYANILWRILIARCASDLGLRADRKLMERDLAELSKTDDIDSELIRLATLALAIRGPVRLAGNASDHYRSLRAAEEEFVERFDGSDATRDDAVHTALLRMLPADYGSEDDQTTWLDARAKAAVGWYRRGAMLVPHALSAVLELGGPSYSTPTREVVDTALGCLAMSGGLYSGANGPLESVTASNLNAAMGALGELEIEAGADIFAVAVRHPDLATAVDRACAYLEDVQNDDGSFPGQYENFRGHTAICLLALLSAGRKWDDPCVQKGMNFIMSYKAPPLVKEEGPQFISHEMIYCDTLTMMLIQTYLVHKARSSQRDEDDPRPEPDKTREIKVWHADTLKRCFEDIVKSRNTGKFGGWAYFPEGSNLSGEAGDYYDNSVSHFAMLGYHVARSFQLDTKDEVEIDSRHQIEEAERLIETYDPDGRLKDVDGVYVRGGVAYDFTAEPGGWAYRPPGMDKKNMQMTAAGMGSLALIRDQVDLGKELDRKAAIRLRGAEAWLAENFYEIDPRGKKNELDKDLEVCFSDGYGAYFNLYTVGRTMTLMGKHLIDGRVDWYDIGARKLLAYQQEDGAWRSKLQTPFPKPHWDQVVNTSMAILFLTHAAPPMSNNPNPQAPRPPREPFPYKPHKPDDPITPGPEDD